MGPTDVISLEQAKEYLRVDDNSQDVLITTLIQTAISWVEQYTCHMLYERVEMFNAYGCATSLPYYPIEVTGVTYNGDTRDIDTYHAPLATIVRCENGSVITATVGYRALGDIPSPMITSCYKIITYLYENRDAYGTSLPVDIQLLINQYRRAPTI